MKAMTLVALLLILAAPTLNAGEPARPGRVVTRSGDTVRTRIYDEATLVAETIESPGVSIERTYDGVHGVMYETRIEHGVRGQTTFRTVDTRRILAPAKPRATAP